MYTKEIEERRLVILRSNVAYQYMSYKPRGSKSYYEEEELNGYIDAFIDLERVPILLGGKLL